MGRGSVLSVFIVARMRWASSLLFMYLDLGPVLFNKKHHLAEKKKKKNTGYKVFAMNKKSYIYLMRICTT